MARENLTRDVLEAIPASPYDELRGRLRTGDVALFSGNALISRTISRFTRSPISHAAVVVVVGEIDRVFALEAVEGHGVRMAPLSRLVWSQEPGERYQGRAVVLRHCHEPTHAQVVYAARWATDQLTSPYSYRTLVAIGLRIALGRTVREKAGAYICSQFVAHWFERAGQPLERPPYDITTPADLFRDPNLELLARIL